MSEELEWLLKQEEWVSKTYDEITAHIVNSKSGTLRDIISVRIWAHCQFEDIYGLRSSLELREKIRKYWSEKNEPRPK